MCLEFAYTVHGLHVCIRVCSCRQVPWSALGRQPVVVELDRIYVLLRPKARTSATGEACMVRGTAGPMGLQRGRRAVQFRVAARACSG